MTLPPTSQSDPIWMFEAMMSGAWPLDRRDAFTAKAELSAQRPDPLDAAPSQEPACPTFSIQQAGSLALIVAVLLFNSAVLFGISHKFSWTTAVDPIDSQLMNSPDLQN